MGRLSAVNSRIRDVYWERAWLQQLYSTSALCGARWAELTGDPYAALVRYCNAARRVRSPQMRSCRLQNLAEFVHRHFAVRPSRTLAENVFVRSFLESGPAHEVRAYLRMLSVPERLNLRGNLIVLKAPQEEERGVLLVQYTHAFEKFLVNFRLDRIGSRYSIVLEPSWATYPEPYWAYFSCRQTPVFAEVISEDAAQAVRDAGLSVVPVTIGAQDWVDPEVFRPLPGVAKEFDVAMIANFARFKRHAVLFQAMRKLRPRRLRVAILGGTWERTRAQFEAELRHFGVEDDCTIFQGLSAAEVNEVLNRSKVNLLLSKVEGGNRGLMEGFAANVPCVVYKRIVGPRHSDINSMTGLFADDNELADVLLDVIRSYDRFEPQRWFLQNTGCRNTTAKLNAALRREALRRGEKWTRYIVAKANRPESEYVSSSDAMSLRPAWQELQEFLADL